MNSDLVPEVPLAAQEVAWYNFSAPPGVGSNAVFAGHVNWSGDAVFHDLNKVKPGDRIELKDARGVQLVYTVTDSLQIDAKDKAAVQMMGPTADDVITLITCDGEYRYTGHPILRGEYNKRRIIRATLTSLVAPPGHPLNPVRS
jgi:LPXTG-site transpeptidase (sortase) family protein